MKVKFLLTALLLTIMSASASYAHDGHKDKCCKDKCTTARCDRDDDCDMCWGLFRGWGGWRHAARYHGDAACCSKDHKVKECSAAKSCGDGCDHHHWRGRRAAWRYHHYHNHGDNDKHNDD